MNGLSSLASWILMSLGTSGMLLFVSLSRLRRALPPDPKSGRLFGISGDSQLGYRLLGSFSAGLFGVLLTGLALIFLQGIYLLRNPIFSALFEEGMKLTILGFITARALSLGLNKVSSSRIHTFAIGFMGIQGMALGIGFGLGEAILYSLDQPQILLLRGMTSIVLHALTGTIASRYLGTKAVGKGCWKCPLVATGLHLVYNYVVEMNFPYNYFVFFLLMFFATQILRMFSFQDET